MTNYHTSGPWTFEPQVGPSGRCFLAQVFGPTGVALADIASTDPPDIADANARLIASASELLASVQDFVEWLGQAPGSSSNVADIKARALAAIAKATGAE